MAGFFGGLVSPAGNPTVNSGSLSAGSLQSGTSLSYYALAGQDISGVIAVSLGSGGQFLVPAERQSGLRLPAIGVNITNGLSGTTISFVNNGFVSAPNSGTIASGNRGYLYVGSGGLIVNQSGFMGGTSSGVGPNMTATGGVSGQLVQRIGIAMSGGIFVCPDLNITSGLFSGSLGQW